MGAKRKAEDQLERSAQRTRVELPSHAAATTAAAAFNPFAGVTLNASLVATTTSTTTAATNDDSTLMNDEQASTVWNQRMNRMSCSFHQKIITDLRENPNQDVGPLVGNFLCTITEMMDAYKASVTPPSPPHVNVPSMTVLPPSNLPLQVTTVTSSTTPAASVQALPPQLQQPQPPATTVSAPASATAVAAPFQVASSVFHNPAFSTNVPLTPVASSSLLSTQQPQPPAMDDPDAMPPEPQVWATKTADEGYTDVLLLDLVAVYREVDRKFTKYKQGPLRVQSSTPSSSSHPVHRLIMREPATGNVLFNVAVGSKTPMTFQEVTPAKTNTTPTSNKPLGVVRFVAKMNETRDEKFALKAALQDGKRLYEALKKLE